jgi:hypothetical protein
LCADALLPATTYQALLLPLQHIRHLGRHQSAATARRLELEPLKLGRDARSSRLILYSLRQTMQQRPPKKAQLSLLLQASVLLFCQLFGALPGDHGSETLPPHPLAVQRWWLARVRPATFNTKSSNH